MIWRTLLGLFTAFVLLIAPFRALAQDASSSPHLPPKWDFDSNWPEDWVKTPQQKEAREIYKIIKNQMSCWNGHDLEGYIGFCWHSPLFFSIENGALTQGWEKVHGQFLTGYRNSNDMGNVSIERVRVRLIGVDVAYAVCEWTVTFPGAGNAFHGVETDSLQKFQSNWKVIASHSTQQIL